MIKKIQEDIVKAMKAKDAVTLSVLRAVKTACTNASLVKGSVNEVLSDLEVIGIIRKQHTQRLDSIEQFKKAERQDLCDKELEEVRVLEAYLPEELSDEKLEEIAKEVVELFGGRITKKDFGTIMKTMMVKVDGKADNKRISKIINGMCVAQ